MKTNNKSSRCDVIVMAPLDVLNSQGKPWYINKFTKWCKQLKSGEVDGVMIDVWWGLVERSPKSYDWEGYDELFKIMKDSELKIIPVLSFHQCSGNVGDTVHIPIPSFVFQHEQKPYFVDKFDQKNNEYISFSYDTVKLGDRTPLEMYKDFMKHFRNHFDKYFYSNTITKVEVGLGPCGELRYPSYLLSRWDFPGNGSFQCYDEEFKKIFKEDSEKAGHSEWTSPPTDTGDSYNEFPGGPEFWRTGYTTDFGKHFLKWYTQKLIDHGRNVLKIAREVFPKTKLSGKVAGIHWQYMHHARCAEATAGYYNTSYHNGYAKIAEMFRESEVDLCFTCLEMTGKDYKANSDPEGLVSDVLREAHKRGLEFEGENALECYDWSSYNQILKWKSRGLSTFTFLRMSKKLMEDRKAWLDFKVFTNKMHYSDVGDKNKLKTNENVKYANEVYDEKENSIFLM